MWLSVRVSVVVPTDCVERRTLCPRCGSRPRWAATITRGDEIIEKNWWCPACFVVLQSRPQSKQLPHVLDHHLYVDESRPMN